MLAVLVVLKLNWETIISLNNNQQSHIADCLGIELNGHFQEIVEKFCYLGDTIRVKGGAFGSVITNLGFSAFANQQRFALRSKRQIVFCMYT